MRILLVNPPVPFFYYNREYYVPTSLLYLGAVLENNGEEVRILDMKVAQNNTPSDSLEFYEKILTESVSNFQPNLVGLGCLFSGDFPNVRRFSDVVKRYSKDIPVVVGGIHPTIYPHEILSNCSSIDWIILGEGERSIVQLVENLKNDCRKWDEIDGFAYRQNGEIKETPKRHYIENLDEIPFPAYNLIDLKDYYVDTSKWHNPKNLPINMSIPIIASRSCPNRCSFCSMYMAMGTKWRARSPENVVTEIEYLYNKYDHHHFSFMDDNLTFKKEHIFGMCGLIKERGLDIQFETPNGLSMKTLDEEVLDALVSTGLVRVSFAIESGSDFIRNKVMKKHLSSEKIREIINITKKYSGLYVKAFFIIGVPEETKETLEETYNMIKEIDVDRIYLHNIVPYPGTEIFEQALRDDLLINIDPKTLYNSESLYLTNYKRFFIKPYKLSVEDLSEFRKRCEDLIVNKNTGK